MKEILKKVTEPLFHSAEEREGSKGTSYPFRIQQYSNKNQRRPQCCAFGAMENALLTRSFSVAL